jgi:kanamycin kinase
VTFPSSHPPVPAVVRRFADGRPVRAVWVNEEGGVTFRLGSGGSGRDFVKVANARGWLHTRGLPGLSAVHPRWLAAPAVAVRAIGAGLRALHDRLPERTCPFEWSAAGRLAALTPATGAGLGEPPPVDRLVVCHGDACAPNTLIDDDGRCCGHVDFGELGVADRWADLAVATLSLGWNYPGRGWEAEFFAAYGVEPDPARIDYYRRLWQASDGTSR